MANIKKCQIEKISEFEHKLSIIIHKEEIQKEVNISYEKLSKKVNLKGFRQGKIPRKMLEQYYHKDILEKSFNKLVQKNLQSAVLIQKLTPVSMPKIENKTKFNDNKDFSFTAIFQIKPEIIIKKWQNLKFTAPIYIINDKGIEKELKQLQKQQGSLIEIKNRKTIEKGDFVQCKYSLKSKDEKFKDKPKAITIEVGAKLFFQEAEKALIGKKIGDCFSVEVLIPSNNLEKKKTATLTIDIDSIKLIKLPNLDDEFAKDIAKDFSTLEKLKKAIKEKQKTFKIEREDDEKKEAATEALIKANHFNIPSNMVDTQAKQMAFNSLASFNNEKAKEIWKEAGEQIIENMKPKAEKIVKAALLCEKIAQEQNIIIDDKTINKEIAKEAIRMNVQKSTLKSRYTDTDLENMKLRLTADKAIVLVINNANITFNEKILF